MKPWLLVAAVAGLTACAPPSRPQPDHVPAAIVIAPVPIVTEHKTEVPKKEPVRRTLERAQWHADYAKGLIKAHRAKEGN